MQPSWSLCRNVGSQWALEQAKYNLVNEYMLVGVTEELEDFVMMLEAALPRFFRGATELYKTGAMVTKYNHLLQLFVLLYVLLPMNMPSCFSLQWITYLDQLQSVQSQ